MIFLTVVVGLLIGFFIFFTCVGVGLMLGGDPGGMLGTIVGLCAAAGWGAQCAHWTLED